MKAFISDTMRQYTIYTCILIISQCCNFSESHWPQRSPIEHYVKTNIVIIYIIKKIWYVIMYIKYLGGRILGFNKCSHETSFGQILQFVSVFRVIVFIFHSFFLGLYFFTIRHTHHLFHFHSLTHSTQTQTQRKAQCIRSQIFRDGAS